MVAQVDCSRVVSEGRLLARPGQAGGTSGRCGPRCAVQPGCLHHASREKVPAARRRGGLRCHCQRRGRCLGGALHGAAIPVAGERRRLRGAVCDGIAEASMHRGEEQHLELQSVRKSGNATCTWRGMFEKGRQQQLKQAVPVTAVPAKVFSSSSGSVVPGRGASMSSHHRCEEWGLLMGPHHTKLAPGDTTHMMP